jgi:hypothetical protein
VKKILCSVLLVAALTGTPASAKNGLRVFDGNGCSGDGGNCLPDVIVTPKSAFSALVTDLDRAVKNGTTAEFFNSPKALHLFPVLEKHPEKLQQLRNGITVHRVDRPNGMTFFVATKLSKRELLVHIKRRTTQSIVDQIALCMPIEGLRK